jgi:hypothetical protein
MVLVAAYRMAPVMAEIQLGRPSSTIAIGFGAGLLAAILYGGFVLVMAMLCRWVARRAGIASATVPMWLAGCILAAAAGAILVRFVIARTQVAAREFERRPHVVLQSARIAKLAQAPSGTKPPTQAPLLYSILAADAVAPSIEWNGRPVSASGTNGLVTVLDANGARLASTDLHALDYIVRIHATPFCRMADGSSALAVLVTLRASSRRSMFILHDADGTVIHQEHLERTPGGSRPEGPMSVMQSDGRDLLIVDHGAVDAYSCSTG